MCLLIFILVHFVVYLKIFVNNIEDTCEKYTLRKRLLKPEEVIFTTSLDFFQNLAIFSFHLSFACNINFLVATISTFHPDLRKFVFRI